jgi:hypothetical protein
VFEPGIHYIECPRFGGTRCAACCVFFDRYKTCRRKCAPLGKHLIKYSELPEQAKNHFEERKKKEDSFAASLPAELFKSAGENLPNAKFGCNICKFIAKSERGLKVHMKRSHGSDNR